MSARRSIAVALAGLAALTACADIEPLAPDTCGNGVVEAGEDCDVYPAHAGDGLACGSDAERACRYVCDPAAASPACPTGWSCGDDGVCAYASGAFAHRSELPASFDADDWDVHDIDGDGAPDVTGQRANAVLVQFGDGDGQFESAFELATPAIVGPIAADDLDGDGAADAVVPLESGLYLLRGVSERLEPVATSVPTLDFYPESEYPGGAQITPLRFDALYFTLDELTAVASTSTTTSLDVMLPAAPQRLVLPEHHPIEELTMPVATADIDNASLRCDEIALAFAGDDVVRIYNQAPPIFGVPNRAKQLAEVGLPGMAIDQGAAFADVDGDGRIDLLVSVDDDRVAVAYGDGLGGFGPAAIDDRFDDLLEIYDPFGVLDDWYTTFRRWPLLAADFNGDGVADYMSQNGIYLTDPTTNRLQQTQWRFYLLTDWVQAVTGDFNRDGFVDVAAIAAPEAGENGIDVFLGSASSEFTNFFIATADAPRLIAAGDFDGDFIDDIAIARIDRFGGPDTIDVLYGNQDAGLSAPIDMGTYAYVYDLDAGRLREVVDVPGNFDDLMVRAWTEPGGVGDRVFAFVRGSSVRRMVSMYIPRSAEGTLGGRMNQVVLGHFSGAGAQPDAVALGINGSRILEDVPRYWFLPGAEGAAFDIAHDRAVDDTLGDDTCRVSTALLSSGDLDADGVDEFVAIDQTDGCPTLGAGDSPAPRMVAGSVTGSSNIAIDGLGALPGGFRVPYQVELDDLDGDGAVDLVVTFAGEYLISGGTLSEGSGAVVYWNTGDGLNPADSSIVLVPAGVEHIVGAVPLDADEDPGRELALLTDAGLYVCELDGRSFADPCRAIAGVAGLRRTKNGGERLRVADANRDGLDDVLVGRRGRVDVYLAVRHFDQTGGMP